MWSLIYHFVEYSLCYTNWWKPDVNIIVYPKLYNFKNTVNMYIKP